MTPYNPEEKLALLQQKGGMMFFTIVRPTRVFRGLVIVSCLKSNHFNRDVFVKEYRYSGFSQTEGGQNATPTP